MWDLLRNSSLPAVAALAYASGTGLADVLPTIDSQTTMLYYTNIDAPARFYGETLGLSASMDTDWVKIFKITDTSAVGIVTEGDGAYHRARPDNAVMLSIVTSEIDAWYDRLKAAGDVKFLKDIYNSTTVPIRAFLVEDPGGYTVEFYQWLDEDGRNHEQ